APDRQVDIVWTPAHSSMRGNEHAHLTARDLAHQATEETLEPTPLTTYQEITQHYRLNRRTLPAPHPSLTRNTSYGSATRTQTCHPLFLPLPPSSGGHCSLPQDQLLLVERADRARTAHGYLN
ncbi:hypothetical protein HPB47_014116, partial [Ixodes persulcatus]